VSFKSVAERSASAVTDSYHFRTLWAFFFTYLVTYLLTSRIWAGEVDNLQCNVPGQFGNIESKLFKVFRLRDDASQRWIKIQNQSELWLSAFAPNTSTTAQPHNWGKI